MQSPAQLSFDDFTARAAIEARDVGMASVAAHAEENHAGWKAEAAEFVRLYAETHREFISEACTDWAYARDAVTGLASGLCDGWFISFCSPEGIAAWRDSIEAAGLRYKRACFWHKPDGAPQMNGQGPAFAVEPFVTAWAAGGYSRWNGGGRRNLFTHLTNQSDRHGMHPTEKPLSLMAELVGLFSNPGELICDPFMGTGTTGVACIKPGRRFVGIERDPKYFDVACERVDFAARQPDMFGEFETAKQPDIFLAAIDGQAAE